MWSPTVEHVEQLRRAFAEMVGPGDGRLSGNLDEAALLVAQAIDASIEPSAELHRLDELASSLSASNSAELAVELFGGVGHDPAVHFAGNPKAYYDVENSQLNRVLDRRMGIPITLSVLLIEVGRRLDIALHGVGMPGHFLVGSEDGFIDPFNNGMLLNASDCEQLFQQIAGRPVPLPHDSLLPTPPALIIRRMLQNLVGIASASANKRLHRAIWALIATYPNVEHRAHLQHAFAAAEIGQFGEAATAAERSLASLPSEAAGRVQTQIVEWRARLN